MIAQPWTEALKHFSYWLAAAGRRPGTIRTRTWWIANLAKNTPGATPTTITTTQISTWLANPDWCPATRKSALASIRRFYHWLTSTDQRPDDPTKALLSIKVPRRRARPTPDQVLSTALAKTTTTEQRLMLLLAAYAGLRRNEIATLHTSDVLHDWLSITGKGGITRLIPTHPCLLPILQLKATGYFFPGRFNDHRSSDNIGRTISRLLGPGYTSHQLRHWFATTAYHATQDLRAVQELLGHADISTTQTYVGLNDEILTQTVLTIPDLTK